MELGDDLSFESLLKLEAELGSKVFRETQLAGGSKPKAKERGRIRRASDDEAPEEISSKRHAIRPTNNTSKMRKEIRSRDPRFDSRTGTYKEHHFRKNFKFAFDLRDDELVKLKKSYKEESTMKNEKKFLIQRLENQKREQNNRASRRPTATTTKSGAKYFPSKKEQFAQDLVKKYEDLKDSGKLQKHLEKRRKKQAGKERKKMKIEK